MAEPIITTGLSATVASGGIVTAIGLFLGVDPIALFCAFIGAVVWHGVHPSIDVNYESIKVAFFWLLVSMTFGTLGGMIAEVYIQNNHASFKNMPHVAGVGLPALLLAFSCRPILARGIRFIKEASINK
jgi:hypothetical protein